MYFLAYSHTWHIKRHLPVGICYNHWGKVVSFVAKEIILISSKCRVVKKCPPDGAVVDCQIQLMLHSTDGSSDSCVALLKDQSVSYVLYLLYNLVLLYVSN